jgi:hypothetical protein
VKVERGRNPNGTFNPETIPFLGRFHSHVEKTDSCWLWLGGKTRGGYGVTFMDGRIISAHRASYQIANGAIPDGLSVLHKCDVRSCVNPDHLFVGTHKDNYEDSRMKRRHTAGERSGMTKVSNAQVAEIRALRKSGTKATLLAKQFSLSVRHIYGICGLTSRKESLNA